MDGLRAGWLLAVAAMLAGCGAGYDYEKRLARRVTAAEAVVLDTQVRLAGYRARHGVWPEDAGAFARTEDDGEDPFTVRIDLAGAIHVDFGGEPRRSDLAGTGYTLHPRPAADAVRWRCENRGMAPEWLPARCR